VSENLSSTNRLTRWQCIDQLLYKLCAQLLRESSFVRLRMELTYEVPFPVEETGWAWNVW
jgi:hypothetical protein